MESHELGTSLSLFDQSWVEVLANTVRARKRRHNCERKICQTRRAQEEQNNETEPILRQLVDEREDEDFGAVVVPSTLQGDVWPSAIQHHFVQLLPLSVSSSSSFASGRSSRRTPPVCPKRWFHCGCRKGGHASPMQPNGNSISGESCEINRQRAVLHPIRIASVM